MSLIYDGFLHKLTNSFSTSTTHSEVTSLFHKALFLLLFTFHRFVDLYHTLDYKKFVVVVKEEEEKERERKSLLREREKNFGKTK